MPSFVNRMAALVVEVHCIAKLTELRSCMLFSAAQSNIPLYTGLDLATGLPTSLIDAIVDNCHKIHSETDLDNFAMWHSTKEIMSIIDSVLN